MTRSAVAFVVLLVCQCANPVRDAEAALAASETMRALRIARAALAQPNVDAERRKRLGAVVRTAAVKLLAGADEGSVEDARELLAAMPPDTEEREQAARRLFRVIASTTDEAGLRSALTELEGAMGDETQVRSNLRAVVTATRGKAVSVAAAQVVAQRWPNDADRWLDLAASQAAVAQWEGALQTLGEAHRQLSETCAQLPARMARYDDVRRKSVYGEVELKRCHAFHKIAALFGSYSRRQQTAPEGGADVSIKDAATAPCPAGDVVTSAWTDGMVALTVAPAPEKWWLDGARVGTIAAPVSVGKHSVTWMEGQACRRAAFDVTVPTALLRPPLP